MRMRPSGLFPGLDSSDTVTPEVRDVALKETDRVIGELEKIRSKHNIASENFDLVVDLHRGHVQSLAMQAAHEKYRAKMKRYREKMKGEQASPEQPAPLMHFHRGGRGMMAPPMMSPYEDPFDFLDDDE